MVTKTAFSQQRLIDTVGVVLFAVFAAIILYNGADVSMAYDDSFNASVAKNISLGLGYVSTYDAIKPFDVKVTTGPTLLVPAALMMKAFGNTYWAPNLATAIVTVAMLALVLYYASRRLRISFGLLALSCVPPLTILLHLVDGWNRLRGDILAAELIVLGALILPFEPEGSVGHAAYLRRIGTAGVVLGLAALTKFLAFACIGVIALVFIVGLLMQSKRDYRGASRALLALGAGVLIPNVLLEVVRFASLRGWSGYVDNLFATLITNAGQEPSVAQIAMGRFDFAARIANISQALETWWGYVGLNRHPIAGALLLLGWTLTSAWGLSVARAANRLRLIALAIAGGGLMVLFFIIFIPQFASRVQLGACVLSLFVGFATAEWANIAMSKRDRTPLRSLYRYSPAFPLTLIAVFSVFWLVSFSSSSRTTWASERASVVSASEAMLAIRANEPNATFCGVGWLVPRVLEYALPGTLWFRDCRPLLKGSDPKPKFCEHDRNLPHVLEYVCGLLSKRSGTLSAMPAATYFVREPWLFDWIADAADREFARQCDREVVYSSRKFMISRCPSTAALRAPVSE